MEVKYDCAIPCGSHLPETQKYAALLGDAFSLSLLSGRKLLLYVAGLEMNRYLHNQAKKMLGSSVQHPFVPIFSALPKTAKGKVKDKLDGIEEL